MLRHAPSLEVLQHALRHHVCRHCRWRTPGSEDIPLSEPRPCEADCSLFRHLPDLARTAKLIDPMLRAPEVALRHRIADLCRPDGTCPLRQYQHKVARIVAETYDI